MFSVILAAGRGSRMRRLTEDRPKCLVRLGGHPLLSWQVAALEAGGASRPLVVTGYMRECIEAVYSDTLVNPDWETTNMVASLLCASPSQRGDFLVSYSDIVYSPETVRTLIAAPGEIAIAFDRNWLQLWSRRFPDPLDDAESFDLNGDGTLRDIGRRASSLDEVQGQYMGLLKLTQKGMAWIREVVEETPEGRSRLDMTALLSLLVARGRPVHAAPCDGAWCEVDSESDLAVAEGLVTQGALRHAGLQQGSFGMETEAW